MENQIYIGIDVSSATLDVCVRNGSEQQSFVIANQPKDIRKFLKPFTGKRLVIAMENTGRYNWSLYEVLAGHPHLVFVISPLHLKKSMGLARGKNDKIDAIRIALFIEKNYRELKPWKCPSLNIRKLKILLTERSYRIRSKAQLIKQQYDYAKMKKLGLDRTLLRMSQQLLTQLDKQIEKLENDIEEVIKADQGLQKQVMLMRSIPGVGKVLSWMMLVKTEGFTLIDEPRKMACYSGVVPFDHQSGTSIRGKKRVSTYADKSMKSVLHLAAMSAIRLKNDLRSYYQRKVGEGKNRMSVLNAVRNRLFIASLL